MKQLLQTYWPPVLNYLKWFWAVLFPNELIPTTPRALPSQTDRRRPWLMRQKWDESIDQKKEKSGLSPTNRPSRFSRFVQGALTGILLFGITFWAGMSQAQAQCSIQLAISKSGCYQNSSGQSKVWVGVEVSWSNGPANGTITVTLGGQTRTIKTGTYSVDYDADNTGNQTIVSKQVVAFELDSDGSTKTVNAQFSSNCLTQASVTLPSACVATACSGGKLGGQVYKDFNNNGSKEGSETIGLAGVTVMAYSSDGTTYMGVSNIDGNYSLDIPGDKYPVRVEFSALPSFAGQGSVIGTNSKSTVQFVTAATCDANLGILNPTDYCQDKPKIVVPCFVNGSPVPGSSAGDGDALVAFDYGTSGAKDASKMTMLATASQVGTLWGTAYDRYKKRLFTSAFVKRHAGLGPLGLGGIYVTDMTNNTTANYIDVASLGINVGASNGGDPWNGVTNSSRGLNSDKTKPSHDPKGFTNVLKVGIGDLEISEDGQALFFVNLYDKKLYKLDISGASPTVAGSWGMPSTDCSGGTLRPFATKVYNGKVYVGAICDASASKNKSDLQGYVFSFDVASAAFAPTPIFDFPLTYPKGPVLPKTGVIDIVGFYPWTDDFNVVNTGTSSTGGYTRAMYPTPILSDIEIDIDGSIILGLGDRTGIQLGFRNYGVNSNSTDLYIGFSGGDVIRAQLSDGAYLLENNGKLPGFKGYGVGNNQGLGFGEFYNDDYFSEQGNLTHSEIAFGALALKPGSGEVVITSMDPVNGAEPGTTDLLGGTPDSGGIRYLSNSTGLSPAGAAMGFVVYYSREDESTFGKSAGLGDIELTCGLLSNIEIGNRVWGDANADGIQDPNETPIAGVTVQLLEGGSVIATATTDASGNYVFSDRDATSTAAFRYGLNLLPTTSYTVRIPNVQGSGKQSVLGTSALTISNASVSVRDSDGKLVGDNADVTITTGILGQNNHTYDFGFTLSCPSGNCFPTTVSKN